MTREETNQSILEAAETALSRGDQAAAERRLSQGLAVEPGEPALTRALAKLLAGQQRFGEAADRLKALVDSGRADSDLRADLGKLLRLAGRADEAEAELRRLLEEAPDHGPAAYTLAFLLRDRGRWAEAAEVIGGLGTRQEEAEELLQSAGFLWDLGAYLETARLLEKAVVRSPRDPRAFLLLGRAREALGEFGAALEAYRRSLDLNPDLPAAWLRLTRLRRVTDPGDPDLARLAEVTGDPSMSGETRACAGFALAKAWDDLGDYPRAFEQLADANRRWPHRGRWSRERWASEVTSTIRAFPSVRSGEEYQALGPRPIFVVGMLRSGTTLLEQLLARHPAVSGRGELNWVRGIATRLPAPGWPEGWHAVPEAERAGLRDLYLRHAAPGEGSARAFVDKNPLNFRYLGMIAELFPEALLVHMRRDPRDVGLSLYQQAFEDPDNAYAYDLEDIIAFHEGYGRLMAHWERLLKERLRVVRYEEMVSDPDGIAAALLESLGLTLPGEAPGGSMGIRTASAWQARQPVHGRSVGRWRHYENLAPEFFRALDPG